jgi:hypothetical protein
MALVSPIRRCTTLTRASCNLSCQICKSANPSPTAELLSKSLPPRSMPLLSPLPLPSPAPLFAALPPPSLCSPIKIPSSSSVSRIFPKSSTCLFGVAIHAPPWRSPARAWKRNARYVGRQISENLNFFVFFVFASVSSVGLKKALTTKGGHINKVMT